MNHLNDSDPLRASLPLWRVAPPADPAFRSEVWARLEAARRRLDETWSGYCRRHVGVWWLVLLVGLSGASLLGQRAGAQHSRSERETILTAYLAQIDARAMSR